MTPADSSDLVLDGNAVAGLLAAMAGRDMTNDTHWCRSCGDVNPIGRHRLYQGAGLVLRCPTCDALALTLVRTPHALHMTIAGTVTMFAEDL